MPRETIPEDEKHLDPDLVWFVRNLAVADARRDHLRDTGQLDEGDAPDRRAFAEHLMAKGVLAE